MKVATLKELTSRIIRRFFPMKDLSPLSTELVWDICIHPLISSKQKWVGELRQFALCPMNQSLNFSGCNNYVRKQLHILCESLGLTHYSEDTKKGRVLKVMKPTSWFLGTVDNIDTLSPVVDRSNRKRERFCEECGESEDKVELLYHHSGLGPYCDACIEADDELSAHKWEP